MIVIASIADTADNIVTTFGIDWPMFIAQAVNFTLVAAAIWFFGFKKILSTIKEREKQISDSLKNADLIKLELEESRLKQGHPQRSVSGGKENGFLSTRASKVIS